MARGSDLDDFDVNDAQANLDAANAYAAQAGRAENHGGYGRYHSTVKHNAKGNIVRQAGKSYQTKDGKNFHITPTGAVKY